MKNRNIYAAILAASPLAELAGTATGYPTHANLLWRATVLASLVALLRLYKDVLLRLAIRIITPTLYVIAFIAVSYFGVNWQESMLYRVHWLPLLLIDFIAFYAAGYYVHESVFLKYMAVGICMFAVASLALASIGFLDPEGARIIYGPDLGFAIAPAVMLSSTLMVGLLVLSSLASFKKTVLACTLASAGIAYIGKWGTRQRWPRNRIKIDLNLKAAISIIGTLGVLTYVGIKFAPYISGTITRLLTDEEDVLRLAAAYQFLELVGEYFPQGTGYYTFPFLTRDVIEYTTETLSGTELVGMPLHNSYMHYALEGGIVIVFLVTMMHWTYIKTMWRLRNVAKPLVNVLISWLAVSIIFGMLQQFHAYRYFFGMFGFAIGCYHRYRDATQP